MNIYILADLEGISGVYCREQVLPDQKRFDEGRRYLTREINICAEACKAAGAEKVYVRDAHGGSYTLIWEKLSPAVDVAVCGNTGSERYPGLEDCDAVILLGYHAMAGTQGALLEHTMSSTSVQNYWLNGVRIGEIALDSAILTERNKPVIMVSGDDAACAEAKQFLPRVTTAEVKKSVRCFGTCLLSPAESERRIREGVKAAIEAFQAGELDTYPTEKPVRFRVEYTERTQLPNPVTRPYMNIIDGRTIEVSADSVEEALWRIL
ncbi:MAG: M55 family metallopeptidase [Clostridia bacterium]|nr:M55 family metallopeptidase [Clostridia bacterium]